MSSLQRQQIHRKIYPLRILGMALGGLLISSVLYEQAATWPHWVALAFTCLVWPHLAYLHTRLRADHHRAEAQNLLIDSAIAGAWVPLMHFCLLPSVVLVMVTTFDKLSSGIRRLWLHSLPGLVGSAALLTVWLRPEPLLDSSLTVVLCTLPLMVMHTFAVSVTSYRLIRKVARQNAQLEELRRTDPQTRLCSREHWMQRAETALSLHQQTRLPVCLMMVDIDHFKSINDRHGHTVGDEVIRAVGAILLQHVRAHDAAGRYGGDEFAVLCPHAELAEAHAIAERIRERIQGLRLSEHPELRLSSSIGVAAAQGQQTLREWIHAADEQLYRAKHAGRNRVCSAAEPDR